jgi:hypothetical protein
MSDLELFEDVSNPLDSIEDVLHTNEWSFNRPHPDELTLRISGKVGQYSLTFLWQEEYTAMQFFCECDIRIPEERQSVANEALRLINDRLWLGHFDISDHAPGPCFRHTSLFRGWTHSSGAEHVEDLVEIALAECERYYSVFSLIASPEAIDKDHLILALADKAGEA